MTHRNLSPDLTAADLAARKARLSRREPERIAYELVHQPLRDQAVAFRLLPKELALATFELLDHDHQRLLVEAMTEPDAVALLESLDPDDRVRLLDELPAKIAKRLLATLPAEARAGVSVVLGYEPGTVGRIMSPRYVAVRGTATAGDALDAVRRSVLAPEHLATVFVIDEQRRYRGLVRLADLVRAEPGRPVSSLAEAAHAYARADEDAAEAARRLQQRNIEALPVLDREDRLIGALTVDDAMDALDADTTATMFGKAGVADPGHRIEVLRSEQLLNGSILYPVRVRILFLLVTLAGGLAVGGLIETFEEVLASVVAIAVFVPLVMDMGGNVGTQSTTIFARGLALGHINLARYRTHVFREVRIGMVMGCILGVAGGVVAWAWQGVPNGVPQLGLAVGLALFVSVNLACFLGFLLPWLLLKLGLDHAPGADPFITTIKDFTGLLVYFGLCTWVFRLAG